MPEHGTIFLVEDVAADLDHKVWPDSQHVSVECGVMQLAEREAVPYDWFTFGMPIRQDMGSVEELRMVKPTHSTPLLVRSEYPDPKAHLVESLPREPCDVLATTRVYLRDARGEPNRKLCR
jgi:hypothetical protein